MSYIFDNVKMAEVKAKLEKKGMLKSKVDAIDSVNLHQIKVSDILVGIANCKIKPYLKNRGGYALNTDTVKKVETNLHLGSLNQFIAKIDRNGEKVYGDGHSRSEGLIRRFMNDTLTEKELNYEVSFKIISPSEFADTYEDTNSGKNHTATERLKNTDYFMGWLIGMVAEIVGLDLWSKIIMPKFYKQLSYLLWVYREEAKLKLPCYITYASIFGSRKETTNLELRQKNNAPFKVAQKTVQLFAEGIRFYAEVFDHVDAITKEMTNVNLSPVKKLKSSAPFMAMLVSDHMSGMNDLGTSSLVLAKKIVRNMVELNGLCKLLTYASGYDTYENESRIRRLLAVKQ